MYIPMELIWFLLGFIAFPIVCYVIVEIVNSQKKEKYDTDSKERDSEGQQADDNNKKI